MKQSQDLQRLLNAIDRKSYPAYKDAQGAYDFKDYILSIDHVQGDPFASPSKVSVTIAHKTAGFPSDYYDQVHKKTALEDYLLRRFGQEISRFNFKAKGSGKSGLIATSRPGEEVLIRTACEFTPTGITARFEVGFPAFGRTINSGELVKILFDFLPRCVRSVFFYKSLDAKQVKSVIELAEDQEFIRQELRRLGLVSFVADGAILPRETGISDRPMKGSVPFCSPESLKVTLELPHHGTLSGMGIRRGITLIVGGGYHGKSTLLKALESGVYNHIAGDGREYVITDDTAVKLRAEDGRSVNNVDISLFINDLPNGSDTTCFSTADASGSTSQAAAVIESIEAGTGAFLIDEDTSATNFMLRDELMERIVSRDKEPITPFIERARELYETAGISTVLVAGSSGAYFFIADTVIQMDCYIPFDITESVRQACETYHEKPVMTAPGFKIPKEGRKLSVGNEKLRSLAARIQNDDSLTEPMDGGEKAGCDEPRGRGGQGGYGSQNGRGRRGSYGSQSEHGGRGGYGSQSECGGRGGYGSQNERDGRGSYGSQSEHGGRDGRQDRIKVKVYGKDSFQVAKEPVDLRFVEQLNDSEQTAALAQMVRYCLEQRLLERYSLKETVELLMKNYEKGGLFAFSDSSYKAMGLCLPRRQEIFACLNRFRG